MSLRTYDLIYQKDIQRLIKWIFLIVGLLIGMQMPLAGQSRQDLESKRKKLLREIEATNAQLSQTRKDKAAALDRYFTLQRQIKKRQQLIRTLRTELALVVMSIERTNEVIESLNKDVTELKEEFTQTQRAAYRSRINHSSLAFLFAADNFNDLFLRWQYIRQYNSFRKQQASLIIRTQETLIGKAEQLETRKKEKEMLILSQEQQQQMLSKELIDKDLLLSLLKTSESKLAEELEIQQKAHTALNTAIESVIRKEMAEQRKASRDANSLTATANKEEKKKSVSMNRALSGNFASLKGNLPWPVRSGKITRKFGKQAHPTIPTIQITNNGIDILSESRARVFAIYDGKVVGTQYIPGNQNMIIIQHGNYYTVYSSLEEIFVNRGDQVKSGQSIGRLSKQKPEVHFEVWKEKKRMNPILWVKPL